MTSSQQAATQGVLGGNGGGGLQKDFTDAPHEVPWNKTPISGRMQTDVDDVWAKAHSVLNVSSCQRYHTHKRTVDVSYTANNDNTELYI